MLTGEPGKRIPGYPVFTTPEHYLRQWLDRLLQPRFFPLPEWVRGEIWAAIEYWAGVQVFNKHEGMKMQIEQAGWTSKNYAKLHQELEKYRQELRAQGMYDISDRLRNITGAGDKHGADWATDEPMISVPQWQSMKTAPKDGTHIILLTADFGAVEGWWDGTVENFYKSWKGAASYDPDHLMGDWVSQWNIGRPDPDKPIDYRLYCVCTPHGWIPCPPDHRLPHPEVTP